MKVRLNVNVDEELKQEAGQILNELGLDYTTAVTVFLKQVVLQKKIPFEITTKTWWTPEEMFGENWRDGLDKIEDEWE